MLELKYLKSHHHIRKGSVSQIPDYNEETYGYVSNSISVESDGDSDGARTTTKD